MTKRQQLQQILDNLKAGKFSDKELKTFKVTNTAGATISLASPDAIPALEARIAALAED